METLQIEKNALQRLLPIVRSEVFCAAVQAVFDMKGRIVVTGIGKSAIVAQKIVATFNSTGTPALFLHAADAIHGDLGMVQSDDVVFCLSKSGETPEIRILAPVVKSLGSKLLAMTAQPDSTLGKMADFVLHTPIDREADPNNLAPTASTIAQMALGDAMATALLALRGFSHEDFAKYHPGGALGKQLYLRASDLYVQHARPMVLPDTPLRQVIVEISSNRLGAVAVVNENEQIQGIVTDGDLRRMLEKQNDLSKIHAADIMSKSPKTVLPDTMAVAVLSLLRQHSISQILVADAEGKFLGVVHLHDLVREGIV